MSSENLPAKSQRDVMVNNMGLIKERLIKVLPPHINKERFYNICVSMLGNPDILRCEFVSVLKAMFVCGRLGLVPDPLLGHIHIIPFADKRAGVTNATVIIGYKGFVELGIRAGLHGVWANVVFENDNFDYNSGTDNIVSHRPWWLCNKTESGKPIAAYCIAEMPSGLRVPCVMPWHKIMERKAKSKSSAWVEHTEAMALKTPVREASKFWPMNPELGNAVSLDEAAEDGRQVLPVDPEMADVATKAVTSDDWGYGDRPQAAPEPPETIEPPPDGESPTEPAPEPSAAPQEPTGDDVTVEFPCPTCNLLCKSAAGLKKHVASKHPEPKPSEPAKPPIAPEDDPATALKLCPICQKPLDEYAWGFQCKSCDKNFNEELEVMN